MRSFASILVCAFAVVSCSGDDGGDGQGPTSSATTAGSSEGSGSSTTAGSSGPASSSESGSSSGVADESSSSGAATTGAPEDPGYPAPDDGGACPPDTAPIELPGGSVCAPFCAGADAPCPAPASGDATGVCTPFEMEGGSGTPCTTHDDCAAPEACGAMGTCVAVAFWGCRLECSGGETCSDGMICAGDACAYP